MIVGSREIVYAGDITQLTSHALGSMGRNDDWEDGENERGRETGKSKREEGKGKGKGREREGKGKGKVVGGLYGVII